MLRPWWRREAGRCSRYQFECRRGGECIAVYNACDGVPQCADGSDEAPELGCPAPAPPAPSAPHPPQPAQQQPVQQQQPQPPQPQPQALPAPTPAPRAPVQPLKPMQVRALSRIPFCLQELAPHSAKNENTSCHIDTKRAMVADLKKKPLNTLRIWPVVGSRDSQTCAVFEDTKPPQVTQLVTVPYTEFIHFLSRQSNNGPIHMLRCWARARREPRARARRATCPSAGRTALRRRSRRTDTTVRTAD